MSKGATIDQRASNLLYINEMIDGDSLLVDLKTKGLSTRSSNYNNSIILYGHPLVSLLAQDSLKPAGIWVRFQFIYDEALSMNIMTNKSQNKFRDGKIRLTAKEQMIKFQQRKLSDGSQTGKEDKVKIGLYCLLQVTYIYCT